MIFFYHHHNHCLYLRREPEVGVDLDLSCPVSSPGQRLHVRLQYIFTQRHSNLQTITSYPIHSRMNMIVRPKVSWSNWGCHLIWSSPCHTVACSHHMPLVDKAPTTPAITSSPFLLHKNIKIVPACADPDVSLPGESTKACLVPANDSSLRDWTTDGGDPASEQFELYLENDGMKLTWGHLWPGPSLGLDGQSCPANGEEGGQKEGEVVW